MTAKKLHAFQLRLQGYTYRQVAEIAGLSESTLRHNFSSKGSWYKEYQDWSQSELNDIRETVHDALISRALEAAQLIVLLMRNGQPSVAFRAAQDILDRAGFQKSSKTLELQLSQTDIVEDVARWFESHHHEKVETVGKRQFV